MTLSQRFQRKRGHSSRVYSKITFLLFPVRNWNDLICNTSAFVAKQRGPRFIPCTTSLFMCPVGGNNQGDNGMPDSNSNNPLNEWIYRKESDNLKHIREKIAEERLPASYGAMNLESDSTTNEDNNQGSRSSAFATFGPLSADRPMDQPSALARSSSNIDTPAKRPNPYLTVVSRLTPSELISRFMATASPRVQGAVRTTILGLIGGLPQMAFETKTIATGERLANLMFQLQMTGYMFKNAEYRLSLSQSLESNPLLLGKGSSSEKAWRNGTQVKGKIKVRYGGYSEAVTAVSSSSQPSAPPTTSPGLEVEVDAQAYMSELRTQVTRLREELEAKKLAREEEIRKDLLLYIRTLPPRELKALTGTLSAEVLDAMKGLVTAVLAGVGEDENVDGKEASGTSVGIGPKTVTEQSGEALAQLCMWQLVVGFNLRELEVREELKSSLKKNPSSDSVKDNSDGGDGGVQFGPGVME